MPLEPPFLCLLASGGHTLLLDVHDHARWDVLGSTLDDAAGEAFDKGARLLGLGYPGGAAIDRLAREGDAEAFSFPVARVAGLDFSFSGVKTALLYAVRDLGDDVDARRADLAASYQRAIVRALVERTHEAAEQTGAEQIAVVGGVAANSELRASLPEATARTAGALHRQRGDDRLRGALHEGRPVSQLPCARCVREPLRFSRSRSAPRRSRSSSHPTAIRPGPRSLRRR